MPGGAAPPGLAPAPVVLSPDGPVAGTGGDNCRAFESSFGNAFFRTTAELGVRFNQMFYVNTFFDATATQAFAALLDMSVSRLSGDEADELARLIEKAKREGK